MIVRETFSEDTYRVTLRFGGHGAQARKHEEHFDPQDPDLLVRLQQLEEDPAIGYLEVIDGEE